MERPAVREDDAATTFVLFVTPNAERLANPYPSPCSAVSPPPFVTMAKKKKTSDNLGARLTLVMKSGKYSLGYKSTIKTLRSGKCKLVLIGT